MENFENRNNEEISNEDNLDSDNQETETLMYCHDCGNAVSINAERCPHCGGFPSGVKNNDWDSYVLLIIVSILFPLVGIILGIYGIANHKKGSSTLLTIGIILTVLPIILVFGLTVLPFFRDSVTSVFTGV